jgi:DNA-binding MarR family transcriptional regulator
MSTMSTQQPPVAAPGAPDQLISVQLSQISHLLERRLDRALMDHALSLRRFVTLAVIARSPEVSRADLARVLKISPQAVGAVVQRLLAAGLIARKASDPGLPLELSVTRAGLDTLTMATPTVHAAEKLALDELPTETRSALRIALADILAADTA